MEKIRIAILGYGNLGRGIECAVGQNEDMELTAVFTRRDPSAVKTVSGVPVYGADKLPEKKDDNERLLNHMLLEQLIGELGEEEKTLIRLRYFQDKTQVEVARNLGISQVQVSRMEKRILIRMREKLM